jgi:hypothetical protein
MASQGGGSAAHRDDTIPMAINQVGETLVGFKALPFEA